MTSGRIDIHDPLSHPNGHCGGAQHDSESTSDMEDTVEYKVLMAYAKRRRPKQKDDSNARTRPAAVSDEDDADGNETTPSNTLIHDVKKENVKKKKKKRLLKGLSKIFSCTRPQTKDEEVEEQQQPEDPGDEVHNRCFHPTDEPEKKNEEEEKVEEVANRLMELADEIELIPPQLETDNKDGDMETIIALLLRDTGDKWNEKVLKDANIKPELFSNYSFFRTLINNFLIQVGLGTPNPDSPGPQASPKTQMAVMCEVTSRLSSVLPVNGLLNHGARYIQDYFSPWVQKQGGYEAAFEETEEVD